MSLPLVDNESVDDTIPAAISHEILKRKKYFRLKSLLLHLQQDTRFIHIKEHLILKISKVERISF